MGLIDKIFGTRKPAVIALGNYFDTLTAYKPVFSTFSGGLYEMEMTRAAIHTFATAVSKLKPEVRNDEGLQRMLAFRPNQYMDTSKFLYRLATILSVNNTAFIAPMYDERDMHTIRGFYPVLPDACEVKEYSGTQWLVYQFAGGQKTAVELNRSGILTQMQYRSDFFGESNAALLPLLQLMHTQNEGITEGIKSAASIRFLAKLATTLKRKDVDAERAAFIESNLSSSNNGGVLLVDQKYAEVKQLESKPFVIDAKQMELINDNIYSYFGTNASILQNKFTSEEWQAYYEGKVEPFALQLGLVMTNMVYSPREIAFGNEIMFSSNRLQYATTKEKLDTVTQLFDRGLITTNQGLEIFNMPPVEGGDARFIRGEYVNVNDRKEADENAEKDGQRVPPDTDAEPDGRRKQADSE